MDWHHGGGVRRGHGYVRGRPGSRGGRKARGDGEGLMDKVTKLNLEAAPVGERRGLHLRDIQDDNPEPRGSIGARLRAARLARGEDLAEVAAALRIRRGMLEAIEGADYARLPGRAYSIGFIKSYADYLKLDQKAAVAAFKAELDEALPQQSGELVFPDAEEETRLPRGTVLVIAALALAALYGIWTLTVSADRLVEERSVTSVPSPVPQARVPVPTPEADTGPGSADAPPAALAPMISPAGPAASGDGGGTGVDAGIAAPAAPAPSVSAPDPSGLPASADAGVAGQEAARQEAAGQETAGQETADSAVSAPAAEEPAAAEPLEDQISPLETRPENTWEGFVYGQQNHDSRIIVRAHETAWVRVEDGAGNVLLSRTLRAGESYRAPNRPGMVLATRNAGAIEMFVDGRSAGRAGRAGEVVSDLGLDPASLSGQ